MDPTFSFLVYSSCYSQNHPSTTQTWSTSSCLTPFIMHFCIRIKLRLGFERPFITRCLVISPASSQLNLPLQISLPFMFQPSIPFSVLWMYHLYIFGLCSHSLPQTGSLFLPFLIPVVINMANTYSL